MRMVFQYLRPYYGRMILGLIIKILGTLADLGLPWVMAFIIDDIIPLGRVSLILIWGGVMLLLAVAARTGNIVANRKASKVARDTVERIRHDTFEKIGNLSGAQVDRFTMPSLISRLTTDSYNIHQMIGMMQRLGVRGPIILVGGTVLTATLEPVLTLVLIGIMPILAYVVFTISRRGIPLYGRVQKSVDRMVQTVRENIAGIRVIKALSKTEYEKSRFEAVNEELVGRELKAGSVMAASSPLMNLLLNLGLTGIVIVGAFRVNAGASEPGKIVAFLSYFTMILNAVMSINRIFIIFSKSSASADRIRQVLDAPQELIQEKTEEIEGDDYIVFDHVTFGYHTKTHKESSKEAVCVEDINFRLKKGESLGIIGATGSGKTTIINLLMRFYDVDFGEVRVNGRNVKGYTLQTLRSMFGVVFQNDVIFADTLYENISFGRDIPPERVKEAAADARAADFIEDMEGGYEYRAAIKGANLSGGQKQRVLIARALAAKPDILVLDDSSSALDYKTDAALRLAIGKNYSDSTLITVAQRVSSIMQHDHILVLEDGRTLGYGTHEELLTSCPVYREIYESQMGSEVA
ncbi:MAG TPA: ABC transporter ATP-binding protein [Candidatus Caccomorpha excrementavium]|nr:ABC transporter ATP-binding protein [Candidatus Caccomorpha excrementavium]